MNQLIKKGPRSGTFQAPPSKSQAHRFLICAALSGHPMRLSEEGLSADVRATKHCLEALAENREELCCGESASTFRFLIPIVGALGRPVTFHSEGSLMERPHAPYLEELRRHGMLIEQSGELVHCHGTLQPGVYRLPGNISSQFVTGLLFALPLLPRESVVEIEGELQSAPYVALTEADLLRAGITFEKTETGYRVPGKQSYNFLDESRLEGDWSAAAVFLCMGALSEEGVRVEGVEPSSAQGDRRITDILRYMGAEVTEENDSVFVRRKDLHGITVDAGDIPDLVPAICALASVAGGLTRIINADRLRMKETDRIRTTVQMLSALGADIKEQPHGIAVTGKPLLAGGSTDSFGDHRIAMAAAVAACGCAEDVVLCNAECVEKSFPGFFERTPK